MRDTDDLRRALAAETAHLTVHIPIQTVRRRARGIRVRRSATVAVAGTIAALAVAAPIVLLRGGSAVDSAPQPPAAPPPCPTTPAASPGTSTSVPDSLGPFVDTGSILDAAGGVRYDVLIGLVGTREQPGFAVAFRDRNTGAVEVWQTTGLLRGEDGDLPSKMGGAPYYQFLSDQLTLGPRRVLDIGLYTRTAYRLTVASEGRESDAETELNAATGWTLFWVERSAAPVPSTYNMSAEVYTGPEVPTLTAYDANGRTQHTVTGGVFAGNSVQNPRDHQPDSQGSPSPPPPCGDEPGESPTGR